MAVTISGGGQLSWDTNINMEGFRQGIQSIRNELGGLTTASQKQAEQMDNLVKKTTSAIAAYASFSAGTNFIQDVVRVRGEFQQLEIAFSTMLGSKEKADKLMQQAVHLAATTPFELKDVAAGAKQLLAYGFAAEDITGNLKMLGDIASGVGTDLNGLVYLYGTLKTSGRVTIMDLQQFAGRGVPIFETLAKQLNVATSEIRGMVSAGKIGFPEIERAFQSMTGPSGMFFNLMEQQSKSLTGMLSNLSDAWNQMLNDIGRSNQGVFTDIISTATSLVNNYEKVITVLKLAAITYGTYRAAILLTATAEKFQAAMAAQTATVVTSSGRVITAQLYGQNAALAVLKTGWMSLYTTVASFAPIAVISAVAIALYSLTQTIDAAAESQKNLSDVQATGSREMAKEKENISQLTDIIKDQTRSRQDQLDAVQKLREETGTYLNNYTDEEILAGKAKNALDKYTESIYKNAVAKAAQNKISDLTNSLSDLEVQGIEAVNSFERLGETLKAFFGAGDFSKVSWWDQMWSEGSDKAIVGKKKEGIQKQINDLKTTFKKELEGLLGIGKGQGGAAAQAIERTVEVIDNQIEELKKEQLAKSTEGNKLWDEYAAKIKALEEERKRITGATKKDLKEQESLESKINALLNERKNILDSIEALKRDAKQSGLVKEQSELDKVNEKYDLAIKKVEEYNKKIAAFNAKNKTNVQGLGLTDINALKAARDAEINNTIARQNAEIYKKSLAEQKEMFSQYSEAVKNIGISKAQEMYKEQTKGFESFVDFLQSESENLSVLVKLGVANVGDQIKFDQVQKELNEAQRKQAAEEFKQRVEDFKRLLAETTTFSQKRAKLEEDFQREAAIIRKEFSGEEIFERTKVLRIRYNKEEEELRNSLIKQSAMYKKLSEDISKFSQKQLRARVEELKETLTSGQIEVKDEAGNTKKIKLTEEATKDLKEAIKKTDEEINHFFASSKQGLEDTAALMNQVAGIMNDLGSSISETNPELGEMIGMFADFANTMGNALNALAKGDIIGAIASVIGSMVKALVDAKKIADEAKKAVADFYQQIQFGEINAAIATRDRMVLEAQANKLTLDRLAAQKKALEENKKANQDQTASLLKQLQQEQFIASERTKKDKMGNPLFGWASVFGVGAKTKVDQELQSLAGKSFEQIEKLFNSGQLTESATKLFEQLQKLKQEGVDIDKQLLQLAEESKQIFTGTTADSLTDSIAQMFKEGKTSAQDFAQFFEERMSDAALNVFKNTAIAESMQRFYEEFAAAAQSDNVLTQDEIARLRQSFNADAEQLRKQFEQLQQVTGINPIASAGGGSANSLRGAIKGITEQQAELLASQFSGLRLTNIELLNVARRHLERLIGIESNTFNTAAKLDLLLRKFDNYETGAAKLSFK